MGPKKAAAAAAPAKDTKEKKPAAAPAHASYKGQFHPLQLGRILLRIISFLSPINTDSVCLDMIKEAILNVSLCCLRQCRCPRVTYPATTCTVVRWVQEPRIVPCSS